MFDRATAPGRANRPPQGAEYSLERWCGPRGRRAPPSRNASSIGGDAVQVAIQPTRPPAGRPSPLAHEAPQGLAARYLAALRPILVSATNARANWVRFLNELVMRSDLARAAPEAVQVALGQSNQVAQAPRRLTQLQAPPSYQA